jgi:uncharacterized membrane protein YraQ (UPF0718 family)
MEAIAWGVVLRLLQATLQCAPFLFTGLCVAAFFHRFLGQSRTLRLFGSNSLSSLVQSWLIGMLLPGCSLGVIPIVRQLKVSGIGVGTIFAFALSSPLFDPLSLLYGLTLSKPLTIVAFAACSLVVVTVCGMIFDGLYPQTPVPSPEPAPVPFGVKRLLAVVVQGAREATGPSLGWIACGLAGMSLLAVLLPAGSLQGSMQHENPWSPVVMTAVAIPAYATPMTAMGQLGSMFQHGNSVGAAFILLAFGAGMNLGLLAWMIANYGWKKALVWMGLMIGVVLGLSYGIERPLYPTDIEPADHTHAFDHYCRPFDDTVPAGGYPAYIAPKLRLDAQFHEVAGLALVGALIALGLGLKLLDRWWVIENWLTRASPQTKPAGRFDLIVPEWVLGLVAVAAILAGSAVGCFAYYPPPDESLEELGIARTEALQGALSGQKAHALHWIPIAENWNRRLQVGAFLRHGSLSDYHRMKARVFQSHLERLEHMLEDDDPRPEIGKQVAAASRAYSRLRDAYRDEFR